MAVASTNHFGFPLSSTLKHQSGFSFNPAHTTEPNWCNLSELTLHMLSMKQVCKLDNVVLLSPFTKSSWRIQLLSSVLDHSKLSKIKFWDRLSFEWNICHLTHSLLKFSYFVSCLNVHGFQTQRFSIWRSDLDASKTRPLLGWNPYIFIWMYEWEDFIV